MLSMTLNPLRLVRRWRRIESEAREEAALLRRRYGPEAAAHAQETLERADLTQRYRRVMKSAVRKLERNEA